MIDYAYEIIFLRVVEKESIFRNLGQNDKTLT